MNHLFGKLRSRRGGGEFSPACGARFSSGLGGVRIAVLFLVQFFVASIALAQTPSARLDVRDFGAILDGVADDSPAWIAAIKAANARAAVDRPVCIYQPAGVARLVEPLPMFRGAGCVIGDGSSKTILKLDRAYAGDVFSWSEAWMASNYPMKGAALQMAGRAAGPSVTGVAVVGDRTATAAQNAFVFYDRADFVSFHDVGAFYLNGRCLYSGARLDKPVAYMRESKFYEIRFWGCGGPSAPAVEFDSVGPWPEATNEIAVFGMDIVFPHGDGLVIRNSGAGVVRLLQFYQLRVEGVLDPNAPVAGDLVRIGDPTRRGVIRSIRINGFDAEEPYDGHAAFRVAGPSPGSVFDLSVNGVIGPGPGGGLALEAGRSLRFDLEEIGTRGPKVSIGPRLGPNVRLEGGGERDWIAGLPKDLRDRLTSSPEGSDGP